MNHYNFQKKNTINENNIENIRKKVKDFMINFKDDEIPKHTSGVKYENGSVIKLKEQ